MSYEWKKQAAQAPGELLRQAYAALEEFTRGAPILDDDPTPADNRDWENQIWDPSLNWLLGAGLVDFVGSIGDFVEGGFKVRGAGGGEVDGFVAPLAIKMDTDAGAEALAQAIQNGNVNVQFEFGLILPDANIDRVHNDGGKQPPWIEKGKIYACYARFSKRSDDTDMRREPWPVTIGRHPHTMRVSTLFPDDVLARGQRKPTIRQIANDDVITAVIDDGIPIAHANLRTASGATRVQCFWRMDAPAITPNGCKSTVPFGREYLAEEINALLLMSRDEDDLYRRSGLTDMTLKLRPALSLGATHGAHVIDTAAGYSPHDHRSKHRPVIAVQLPETVIENSSGAAFHAYYIAAIDYVVNRARKLTPSGRVIINLSFGFIAGPHNGGLMIEQHMDRIVEESEGAVQFVISAGNSHLSRCHARVTPTPRDKDECNSGLIWALQPDDRTLSELQIWLPDAATHDAYEITVTDPVSGTSGVLNFNEKDGVDIARKRPVEIVLVRGASADSAIGKQGIVTAQAQYLNDLESGRKGFWIRTLPTARGIESTRDPFARAPAGEWQISISGPKDAGEVEFWIQRDDTIGGFPLRGRQSTFVHELHPRNDLGPYYDIKPISGSAPIKRDNLVNAAATGERPVVVGAYEASSFRMEPYSAGGKAPVSAPGDHRRPDVVGHGSDSYVHRGIFGAGTRSGSKRAISGTSVAAPQVARLIVNDVMTAGPCGDLRAKIAEIAETAEQEICSQYGDLYRENPLDPQRGGHGRLFIHGDPNRSRPRK